MKGSTELESPALRSLNSFDPVLESRLFPEEEKRMEEAKDYPVQDSPEFPSPEN